LDAVLRQDYPTDRIQVIIADGDSTDGTAEIVRDRIRGIANALLLRNPKRIAPTAMNLMTRAATGDVIVRVDGHCEVPTDYVSRCVEHLITDRVDGVGGSITTIGHTPLSRTIALAMSSPFGVGDSAFRTQSEKSLLADTVPFPAYTRSIVALAGPYDEELVRDQDDEYNYRIRDMGGKLLLDGGIHTRYYSRTSLLSLWRQYFEYGFYKVRVLQKHPRQMRPRQFVPPLFAVSLILSLFLTTLMPWGWVALAAIAGCYTLANLTASAVTASKKGWRDMTFLPVVYAILHLSYGFGFLVGLLRFWNRWGDKVGKVPRFDARETRQVRPKTGRRQAAVGIQGTAYERAFAVKLGEGARAFAFWKGRAALEAILRALGLSSGDEVIIPGFTCVVVPDAVRRVGAVPVFADIGEQGYNADGPQIESLVTPRTKAVIAQHSFGIVADLGFLTALCEKHGLLLVEDSAHALGARYHGTHVGLVGHAGFFSSQWSKPYTTGLGGMAVTARKDVAEKIEAVYRQSKPPSRAALARLWVQFMVYSRFFTPQLYWTAQAALRGLSKTGLFVGSSSEAELTGEQPEDHDWLMGPSQQKWGLRELAKMDAVFEHRKAIAALYDRELARHGWPALTRREGSMLLRYPVRTANKLELLDKAKQARVELGSWFESPLHPLPMSEHARLGYRVGQCPNAERAAREVVNLPLHQQVTQEEALRVLEFLFKHGRSGSQA
jgi:dTDP-4-amino-4,6-dideoxygalactose transaminase/glycosyltransferase involved in cell wall biosynthesis